MEKDWMQDDRLKNISSEKKELLQELFDKMQQTNNKKEAVRLLVPVMKMAKEQNLSFTGDEINLLLMILLDKSNSHEKQQFHTVFEKINADGSHKE